MHQNHQYAITFQPHLLWLDHNSVMNIACSVVRLGKGFGKAFIAINVPFVANTIVFTDSVLLLL